MQLRNRLALFSTLLVLVSLAISNGILYTSYVARDTASAQTRISTISPVITNDFATAASSSDPLRTLLATIHGSKAYSSVAILGFLDSGITVNLTRQSGPPVPISSPRNLWRTTSSYSTVVLPNGPYYLKTEKLNAPIRLGSSSASLTKIAFGYSISGTRAAQRQLLIILFATSIISLILAAVGARLLARHALRPLTAFSDVVTAIRTRQDLTLRVPSTHHTDEVGTLTDAFNSTFDQVETMYDQMALQLKKQHQFVADASHELRTPLVIISSTLELLEIHPELPKKERDSLLHEAREEANMMSTLISDLLLLASVDPNDQLREETWNANTFLEQWMEKTALAVAPRHCTTSLSIPDSLVMQGDEKSVEHALDCLSANIADHTPESASVHLTATVGHNALNIRIEDTGPGIPESLRSSAFDRFTTGDPSRHEKHNGLGLAVARTIITAHNGSISFDASNSGGCRLTVILPVLDHTSL